MRNGNRPLGPFGTALLGITAVVGIVLAVHGWSARQLPAGLGSVGAGAHAAGSSSAPPSTSTAPSSGQAGPQAPTPTPTNSQGQSAPGPLLSSQQYAQYAFRVWPGPLSNSAQAAMTGLKVTVRSKPGGIEVTAGVTGQAMPAPTFYSGGNRVYVIEAAMGDDSGNSDYNLGDDGLVVTDAHGRIVQ